MKRILMNKNTPVLVAEYDTANGVFSKNIDVYYIKNDVNDTTFRTNLSEWFKGRGIPSWRDKLDLLLHRLNITVLSELLDRVDYSTK